MRLIVFDLSVFCSKRIGNTLHHKWELLSVYFLEQEIGQQTQAPRGALELHPSEIIIILSRHLTVLGCFVTVAQGLEIHSFTDRKSCLFFSWSIFSRHILFEFGGTGGMNHDLDHIYAQKEQPTFGAGPLLTTVFPPRPVVGSKNSAHISVQLKLKMLQRSCLIHCRFERGLKKQMELPGLSSLHDQKYIHKLHP